MNIAERLLMMKSTIMDTVLLEVTNSSSVSVKYSRKRWENYADDI